MSDSLPLRHLSPREIIFCTIVAVIGGTVGIVAFLNGYFDLPLIVLAFGISSIIAVCLHELGHAYAAQSTGGKVHFIRLGRPLRERPLWKFHFLRFLWHIHSLPFSGSVHVSFYTARFYRLRRCWMIACGPLVNLVLLAPAFFFISLDSHQDPSPFLLGWCLANGLILFSSVRPFQIASRARIHR